MLAPDAGSVGRCLVGVAISLLIVGMLSGTFARHVVQIVPIVLALLVVLRWPPAGAYVAIGVLGLWAFVMALIWLYLLGLSDVAEGTYSAGEVVLTVVIAACSAWGIRIALRTEHAATPLRRLTLALSGLAVADRCAGCEFRGGPVSAAEGRAMSRPS